jgi:DNA-binding NarL/FixJ family response regulator
VARVLALVPDLLFGSQVQGSLTAAGHEAQLIGDEARLRERLSDAEATAPAVLVVDLTDSRLDGSTILQALAADRLLDGVRTLAFFSHVDTDVGERARAAGFDLVIPRSRMAREGAQLVGRLADEAETAF